MATKGPRAERECAGCGEPFTPSSARQRFHSAACRKTAKKAQPAEPTPQEKVVKWATAHGAPIRMLEGWNPENGEWADGSPIGQVIKDIARGAPVAVTARRHGFQQISELLLRGAEYSDVSEDRTLIPIEVLPLVDLYTLVNYHEAGAEVELSTSVYDEAMKDGKLGITFLARRWPSRWREQQMVTSIDEEDQREAAVSEIISDPVSAMQLAEMASRIEDSVEEAERANA